MASYYLLAPILYRSSLLIPGKLIDDTVFDVAALQAQGAVLWPSTDSIVAAASARALALHGRGASYEEMAAVMLSARTDSIYGATRSYHASIVTASSFKSPALKEPDPFEQDSTLLLAFTIGTDSAFRQFKIPNSYAGNASVHIHWTKQGSANELNKTVRWRISYRFFPGNAGFLSGTPDTVEYEAAYLSSSVVDRIVYRSSDLPLVGAVAGYYMALEVQAIAPVGTPIVGEPALFSVDLTFDELINR